MKLKGRMAVILAVGLVAGMASVSYGDVIWATKVESSSNVTGVLNNVLGPENGSYVSLGFPSGNITVSFGTNFLDLGPSGADIVVVDILMGCLDLDVYTLTARHADLSGWSSLQYDLAYGGWRFLDIAGDYAGAFDQVKLTRIWLSPSGLDIDAIGVLNPVNGNNNAVPEPSTLLLLGSGLLGIVVIGRKRAK